MAATTESRPTVQPSAQPNFWKRYSPRGECPMSFTGSALLHVLVPLAFVFILWLSGQVGENEGARPPKMDVVEIEGGGGGLGNLGTGTGKGEPGKSNPTERPADTVADQQPKFKEDAPTLKLPLQENPIVSSQNPLIFDDPDDPFAKFEREHAQIAAILANPLAKAGAGAGTGGASGGTAGKGIGTKPGAGQGNDPNGKLISQQRRRELRWQILASPDPDVHLKKLQALQVVLIVPLKSKPGFVLRYDLSKPGLEKVEMKAVDDDGKVRWMNRDQKEMLALAKALRLSEVPQFAMIYLPTDLERDMAHRELTEFGRPEHLIKMTIWDVKMIDGSYENTPHIVRQILWSDMK